MPRITEQFPQDHWQHLPFVRDLRAGRHFWTVTPSGDWIQDAATGAHYAQLTLNTMWRHGDPGQLLDRILLQIATGKRPLHSRPLPPETAFISGFARGLLQIK